MAYANTIRIDRCQWQGWRIVRWAELVRRPADDAEWDDLLAFEDAEEREAFAARDADIAACWAAV